MKTSARTKLLTVCIIGLLTVPPSMAFAGPEEAAKYYEEASKAYQTGEYEKAAKLLRRAFAEDSNLIYKYNRILALQAMGDIDTALEELDIWENRMKEDGRFDDIDEIRQQLEKAKAEADKKDETKTGSNKDGGEGDKTADGADQKDGDDADKKDGDGADQVVITDPVEPPRQGPNILGWSLVGVGVAGLGSAGLFGSTVLISDVADRRERLASGASRSEVYQDFDNADAQFKEDKDIWSSHQMITWVSLGVGAVALIGGGTVLYLGAADDAEADSPVSAENADVSFSPYVGADGAGGVLHISF